MTRATVKPSIFGPIQIYSIWQEHPFALHISDGFFPQDSSLVFYLKPTAPSWMKIDNQRGILFGAAPKVQRDKPFKITVTAKNDMGFVTRSFIIKVICTDIVESMPTALQLALSLRQEKYGFSHLHPYTPSLLEYIYAFYDNPEFRQQFETSLQEAANEFHYGLPEKIEFKDFEKFIKTINPDIDRILMEKYLTEHEQDRILTEEQLNNWQLRNMYREGSQLQGVHAIMVWNHWGYPDLYNWPDWNVISNVMDAASDAVARVKKINLQQDQEIGGPKLRLRPKGAPY